MSSTGLEFLIFLCDFTLAPAIRHCIVRKAWIAISKLSLPLFSSLMSLTSLIMDGPIEDIQEQGKQGDDLGRDNEDEKDHITRLPFEILSEIFAQLSHEERLTITSFVCKIFREINRPYVYKFIHVNVGKPREKRVDDPRVEEFEHFFSTLLKHDELRGRVISIALKVHNHDLYRQLEGHLGLIKHLKSLKELSLNPPPWRYDYPTNPMTTFLRLDFYYDRISFWQGFPVVPLLELTEFFYIDHIRKLEIAHVSFAPELHRDPWTLRLPRTSLIDHLRFIDCSPQTVGILPHLLLLPQSLKSFVLETTCPLSVAHTPRARKHTMTPQDLYHALEPHSTSLQELVIAFSAGASFQTKSTISLAAWSRLTRLAIPEAFLVRTSARDQTPLHALLPAGLQHLQLQYPPGHMDPKTGKQRRRRQQKQLVLRLRRLERLAESKPDFLPLLQRVVVWCQGGWWIADAAVEALGHLQVLGRLFWSVGVRFECCVGSTLAMTPFGVAVGVREVEMQRERREGDVRAYTVGGKDEDGVGLYWDEGTKSVF